MAFAVIKNFLLFFVGYSISVITFSMVVFADRIPASKQQIPENPLIATAQMRLHPTPTDLVISVSVTPGFYAYINQFKVQFRDAPSLGVIDFDARPIHRFYDHFSKNDRYGIKDNGILNVLIFGSPPKDNKEIQLELTYQACSKEVCLFPKSILVPVKTDS